MIEPQIAPEATATPTPAPKQWDRPRANKGRPDWVAPFLERVRQGLKEKAALVGLGDNIRPSNLSRYDAVFAQEWAAAKAAGDGLRAKSVLHEDIKDEKAERAEVQKDFEAAIKDLDN